MKKIFFSVIMLAGIAATAQKQPAPADTTVTTTTESVKPDVRFLGKANTTTTVTETTTGRRKKRRDAKANDNANAVQQYTAPKDTVSVQGDTIKIYKADTIKVQ